MPAIPTAASAAFPACNRPWIRSCAAGLALSALLSAWVNPAQADYSKLVVFSDSMSDTHRYYDLTKALFGTGKPLSPPAMQGRFCNGPVAVEVLAGQLGIPMLGYSFSGAQTGYSTLIPGVPWGILTQVNEHLNSNAIVPAITTVPVLSDVLMRVPGTGKADPQALYFIWSGPDDYYAIGGFNALTAYKAAANLQQAITTLYNAGARYFFIPTMPDLSITPSATNHESKTPGYKAEATKYSKQFTDVLQKALQASQVKYPMARIMSFDTIAFMAVEMAKARAEGKNLTEACHPGGFNITTQFNDTPVCADPDNHMFWDDNHPTAIANQVLGSAWAKAITVKP